jgi:hypothetical protein
MGENSLNSETFSERQFTAHIKMGNFSEEGACLQISHHKMSNPLKYQSAINIYI